MRIVRVTEKAPTGTVFRHHHLTDLHAGAPDFDEAAFRKRVAAIAADPDARWTFGGDAADLIKFNDRRYQPTELAPRYRQAADIRYASLEHLQELFEPIKDKLWGGCEGNHEWKYDAHYGGKFLVELLCNLGVESRYVGAGGFVSVTFQVTKTQRVTQLIDLAHGWQAGRSPGAFYGQAEKELSMTEADIVLRGHSHRPNHKIFKTRGISHDARYVVHRHRTVLNGGTWRRGYRDQLAPVDRDRLSEVEGDLWGEQKQFRDEPLGGAVILLRVHGNSGVKADSAGAPAHVTHSVLDGENIGDVSGVAA